MPSQENIWSQCLKYLKKSLPHSEFIQYIQLLRPVWSDTHLTLLAPNVYVTERAVSFLPAITNALADAGVEYTVRFRKSNPASSSGAVPLMDGCVHTTTSLLADSPPRSSQRDANTDKTFSRFIVGECNHHVFEVAKKVAQQVSNPDSLGIGAPSANLVIFWGSVGIGKTHLLHAINNKLKGCGVAGVEYVQAESFKRAVVQGIKEKNIHLLMQKFSSLRLLLLDDLHWLAGAPKCQNEVLCLLERLVSERGAQMVITCGCHPGKMTDLESRLVDRLEGGLVVPFEPYTVAVRSGLLLQQATENGRSISPEVAFQAAARMDDQETGRSITGTMKQLCLTKVGQPISLQEIKDVLTRRREIYRVSVEGILQATAEHYETSPGILVGKKRTRSAVNARHVAMYLCKNMTVASYSEIAATFGNRHHTAVMHACRKISKQIQSDVKLAQDARDIKRRLTG